MTKVSVAPSAQGHLLYSLGISYHNYGVLLRGRQVRARWFRLSGLTTDQRKRLTDAVPEAWFASATPEFAPEQRNPVVFFPSQAELNRLLAANL